MSGRAADHPCSPLLPPVVPGLRLGGPVTQPTGRPWRAGSGTSSGFLGWEQPAYHKASTTSVNPKGPPPRTRHGRRGEGLEGERGASSDRDRGSGSGSAGDGALWNSAPEQVSCPRLRATSRSASDCCLLCLLAAGTAYYPSPTPPHGGTYPLFVRVRKERTSDQDGRRSDRWYHRWATGGTTGGRAITDLLGGRGTRY